GRRINVASPAPWRRAFLAASTAMAIGLIGHRLAGGSVDAVAVVLAFFPVLVLTRVQASRELGWWAFAGMLLLSQLVVHIGAASCSPSGMNNSVSMLLAHIAAAAVAGLALRWHEARAWAKARGYAIRLWVCALLRRLPAGIPYLADVATGMRALFLLIADDDRSARIPTRRGPPLLSLS
ncbi:MAG: hypothetical protein Q8L05_11130, partial [Actinomycetota bacterium]|nr:hypothetical protein [Actinomycetota bacterium]